MITYLIVGGVLCLIFLLGYFLSRFSGGSEKVLDVRKTPERQVEDLTVEEFHELARDHLTDKGFVFTSSEEGHYRAEHDGEQYYVRVDPAAECRDPRTMNQFILNVRKSDADEAILVSSRAIKGQSYSLCQRTDTEIVTPDELFEDQRNG